jgi:hypothetical protein
MAVECHVDSAAAHVSNCLSYLLCAFALYLPHTYVLITAVQIMQVLTGPSAISHFSVPSSSGPLMKSLHNPGMRGSASLVSLLSGGAATGVPAVPPSELQQAAVEMEAAVGQARAMLSSLTPKDLPSSFSAGGHPMFSRASDVSAVQAGGSHDSLPPAHQLTVQQHAPGLAHQQGQGAAAPAAPLIQLAPASVPATPLSRPTPPMPPTNLLPDEAAGFTDHAPQQLPASASTGLPSNNSTPFPSQQHHSGGPQHPQHLLPTHPSTSDHQISGQGEAVLPPGQQRHVPLPHAASSSSLGSVTSPAGQHGHKVSI